MRVAVAILALCGAACGQVVQVAGGTSTLLQGTGGGATVYLPTSTLYAGVGCADFGCGFGISQKFRKHKADITLGDNNVSASVDGGGVGISVRGVTIEKASQAEDISVFVGATGFGFNAPFVQTNRAQHFGAGIAYRRSIGSFSFQALGVIAGGQHSAAASVRYIGQRFGFTGAGGLLLNNPFLNGAAEFAPVKNHLKLSAMREQFYLPDAPSSATNSVSASAALWRVSLHATALQGSAGDRKTNGGNIGAGLNLGTVSVQTNYYRTAAQRLLTTTATERIGRHWMATQTVTGNQVAFGGGYTSNRLTVSLDHSVMFFPLGGRGFQQVTDVQVSLRIPKTDAVANFGTNFLPDGTRKFTAYGTNYVRGPLQGSAIPGQHMAASAGRYVIRGVVTDKTGLPVSGAAVALGKALVFSADNGAFFYRTRLSKPVAVVVRPSEFTAPGTYTVVSAPLTAVPCRESSTDILRIVVTR